MKIKKSRVTLWKCIFLTYFVYFLLSYIGGAWYISEQKFTMMPTYTRLVNNLRLGYLMILLAMGLYEFLIHFKYLRNVDKILIALFLLFSIYKTLLVSSIVDTQTLLFQSGVPTIYFAFFAFFLGMDERMETHLLSMSKKYAFLFFLAEILFFVGFVFDHGYTIGMRFASSPILYSFNNGFFMMVYAMYNEKELKGKIEWKILLGMALVGALISTSRGWILQVLICIIMYFLIQGRGKHIFKNLLKATCVLGIVLLIAVLTSSGIVETMINRLGESTRGSQIEAFFQQISPILLINGLGYNATYRFLHWDNFQFIDNQFIFNAFRYGIICIGILSFFTIKPLIVALGRDKELRVRAFGVIHFILAMAGLSIYFTLSIDICCVIAYALAGRMYVEVCLYDKEEIKESEQYSV